MGGIGSRCYGKGVGVLGVHVYIFSLDMLSG